MNLGQVLFELGRGAEAREELVRDNSGALARRRGSALDQALGRAGVTLDVVLVLEVPDDPIVRRIVGRRTDPETGRIYHLEFDPPPPEVAGRLVHRKDDTEEACRTRLGAYHAQTAPIVPFYEKQGLVRKVDGMGSPDDVTARILTALA